MSEVMRPESLVEVRQMMKGANITEKHNLPDMNSFPSFPKQFFLTVHNLGENPKIHRWNQMILVANWILVTSTTIRFQLCFKKYRWV